MYILISIFAAYAVGIISYELDIFGYIFTALFALLIYTSLTTKKFLYSFVIIAFLILSFINCNYNSIFTLKQYVNSQEDFIAEIKKENKANADSVYSSYEASVISIGGMELTEHENTIIYVKKDISTKENSIVQFKGSVADNSFLRNKMLFNYNNYLRSKKIGAVIFVENSIKTIKTDYSLLNKTAVMFRDYAENTFYSSLNKENADVILSVILGDVDYLDNSLYDNIKLMGLAHIFAVSGSHIVLIYGFLLFLLKFCLLSHRSSWLISWSLIWFYGFLIGFPLTVMRALVMFTLLFGSEVFYRKYSSLNSIGLAALILTMYNPFWLFDAGFLLSFSAALSLVIYNKYMAKKITTENLILRTIYLYLFLQLFTLPVTAYYFNYVPVLGIFYNLLLLPIFTVILIYGFMLLILNALTPVLLTIPFKIFDNILYTLRYIINLTEEIEFNGIMMSSMSIELIVFFYITLSFTLYLYNNKYEQIARCGYMVLISFCCMNFVIIPAADNSLYFNVADAGQGLFTMVKYKNTDLIIDCGSTSSRVFGEYTVIPYIVKRGVRSIDGLFISHWDEDHCSGLRKLISSNVKIHKIFSSFTNEEFNEKVTVIGKGNSLKIDEHLSINIMWPVGSYVGSINDTSLVILLEFNHQKILLPGDIEKEAENALLRDLEHVDIIIVPHHGSNTSSTEYFVNKVSPEIAIISYGKNNYKMPSEAVLNRYDKEKSTIISTFEKGEINFILNGGKIYYNTYTNEKSDNYYELYLFGLIHNSMNFCLLFVWIVNNKGDKNELQNNTRFS